MSENEKEIATALRLLAKRLEGGAYGRAANGNLDVTFIENDLYEIIDELPEEAKQ